MICLSCTIGFAQSVSRDTIFVRHAINASIKYYDDAIQGQAGLYNGSQYLEPSQTNEQHPFFLSDDWVFGSIRYDGDVYENVPMLYDISSDKIVTELYYNSNPIVLVNDRVSWFSFSGHTFERVKKDASTTGIPQTGYYEVLYAGATKIIARRQKVVQERIVSAKIERDFEEKNRYYVFINEKYNSVSNKSSALKLLAEQKQSLKQYLRNHNIRFKENPGSALAALAKQYDILKSNEQ